MASLNSSLSIGTDSDPARRLYKTIAYYFNYMNKLKRDLSKEQRKELLRALKSRFEKNMNRHKGLEWAKVQVKLEANTEKLWALNEIEASGGEPDIIGYDKELDEYLFYDCSAETPKGRRNVCYDAQGQQEREKQGIHPKGNAVGMAAAMITGATCSTGG